ncbi:MAG: SRPBCC domain-containing protein [Candidatus Pacebacteria bacterium]|nr:SRPBCC domain-containing protein [Candidatus Paceibacterota bacterium]
MKTIEIKLERIISAKPSDVYKAWLNPKVPGSPWNMGEKHILNPKSGALWYWLVGKTAHYGMFTKIEPSHQIQQTWVSPSTMGYESLLTVTFKAHTDGTLMRLVHANLPNTADGRGHKAGWNMFLDKFPKHFEKKPSKKK